jgi:hypothetical protein
MVMVKNQKGLAHVGIVILVVLVISAIGFMGWKVFSRTKTNHDQPTAKITKKEVKQKTEVAKADTKMDETANWLAFSNEEIGVSFKYPDEWKVSDVRPCIVIPSSATGQECGVNLTYIQSTNKYPPTIVIERLSKSLTDLEAFYDDSYAQSALNEVEKSNLQIKGKLTLRYYVTNSGHLDKLYLIQSNDKVYLVRTVDSFEAQQLKDYMSTFDKVFDSVEIIK